MSTRAARRRADADPAARRRSARDFLVALAVAGLALPGALPGARGAPDAIALLVWLAFTAAAAGALAGQLRLRAWPHAALVPAAWMLALVAVDTLGARDLEAPFPAALAATGIYAAGFAVGRALPARHVASAPAALFALSAALVLAPVAGNYLSAPWPGGATARLLDLSPATLLAECAGVDWLRHPAIYDAAGSSEIDPLRRSPYPPALAAGIVLVMGCALVLVAERRSRTRERAGATPR